MMEDEITGHEGYITVDEAKVAIESGVTTEKIEQYDGYEARIEALEAGGGVTIDQTVMEGSEHAVAGGAVYTELQKKQNSLSEAELAAIDSGVTTATVLQVTANTSDITTIKTALENKQTTLSDTQLAAVNSTITADKVTAYEAYAAEIDSKQNILTDTQMAAANSGVTTAKVATYNAYNNRLETLETTITGLTGAMHFIGTSTTDPVEEATISGKTEFTAGDVCLYNTKEYIYDGTVWAEFGDEGSCLTKTEAANTYTPITRTVNGKALSADITLAVEDISGAVSSDTLTTELNKKQDKLTDAQQTAINSGITNDLVTQISTNTTSIAANTSNITSIINRVAETETDITDLQSQITSNDTDISALQTRATTAETNISSLQSEVTTVKNTYVPETDFTATVEELEDDIATNKSDISSLNELTHGTGRTCSFVDIPTTYGYQEYYKSARFTNNFLIVTVSCSFTPTEDTDGFPLPGIRVDSDTATRIVPFTGTTTVARVVCTTADVASDYYNVVASKWGEATDEGIAFNTSARTWTANTTYYIRYQLIFDLADSI